MSNNNCEAEKALEIKFELLCLLRLNYEEMLNRAAAAAAASVIMNWEGERGEVAISGGGIKLVEQGSRADEERGTKRNREKIVALKPRLEGEWEGGEDKEGYGNMKFEMQLKKARRGDKDKDHAAWTRQAEERSVQGRKSAGNKQRERSSHWL